MMKFGMGVAVLLAVIPLQCSRTEPPVLVDARQIRPESSAKDTVHLTAASQETVGIAVTKIGTHACPCVLKAMGKVLAPQPQTAMVSHAFCGRVSRVHVKAGEWVAQGQELVTLESQEVGAAKSEFFKAVADLELATLNLEREQRLLAGGIGLQKNYVAAEAEHKIALSNHDSAEKMLHVLGFTEEHVQEIAEQHQINPAITLYAPIAGKIVKNNAVLGALVDQSTEIMRIIDPTLLWVDAEIYEKDIAKVQLGQLVEVAVPAYLEEVFAGTVSYIGDLVDDETRTITVRAEVGNQDHRLKPGMFADVTILLNGGIERLVVPQAAILEEGRRKIVFVKSADSFRLCEIETGVVDGDHLEVRRGLVAGDAVVVEGNHLLRSMLRNELVRHGHGH
jgi:cobalt-zinc-cadmium efflux system membrane fusion protein